MCPGRTCRASKLFKNNWECLQGTGVNLEGSRRLRMGNWGIRKTNGSSRPTPIKYIRIHEFMRMLKESTMCWSLALAGDQCLLCRSTNKGQEWSIYLARPGWTKTHHCCCRDQVVGKGKQVFIEDFLAREREEWQAGLDAALVRWRICDLDSRSPWPLKPSGAKPRRIFSWINQAANTKPTISPHITQTETGDLSHLLGGGLKGEAVLQRPGEPGSYQAPSLIFGLQENVEMGNELTP